MIQPLRSTREVWSFDWFDSDAPIPFGSTFILPTCLYVVHHFSRTLIGHELIREIEGRRAEIFLQRLFQERGAPDELRIPEFEDWDDATWQHLSQEFRCQITLFERDDEEPAADEDLQAQLGALTVGPSENVLATHGSSVVAQGLVRAVRQTHGKGKRRALLQRALELVPDLPDALFEMAELEMQEGDFNAATDRFAQAAVAAEPLHVKDRPGLYLKACYGQMLAAWQQGDFSGAIALGENTLWENPTDYSGFRFFLPLLQLAAGQSEEAEEFFAWYGQNYPDDLEDPGLQFGWAYTLFEADEEKEAATRYRRGMLQNLYLAPLLLDLPEPSPDLWQHNDRGDLQFALDFQDWFGGIWEQNPAATRFLRETYLGARPQLERLYELRAKMSDFQDHRYEPDHRKIWEGMVAEEQRLLASWKW